MTSRRSFLAAMAAACVLDPERLLWVPGAKMISIPARPFLAVGDIVTIGGIPWRYIVTAEARSIERATDARFKVHYGTAQAYYDRYFRDGQYWYSGGPSSIHHVR